MNKGKDTKQKNIWHCNLMQFFFPEHGMLKSCDSLILYIFLTVQS